MEIRNRYLLPVLAGLALLVATPAFGATCGSFAYTVGVSSAPAACTIDGGAVTLFNSFNVSGLSGGTVIFTTILDGGAIGQLSGVSFNVSTPSNTSSAFTIGYGASIVGGNFTSVNDSATPGAVNTYSYTGTGFNCPPNVATCIQNIAATSALMNSGTFTGLIPPSQTLSLDFNTTASTATPEPTSLILFGSGFLVVGLASRFRRNRRS